jgi:periplasmic divalent cation tolerance protein
MKTTEARFPALSERLRALHPYELPEIIAVPVTTGLPEYLQWVSKCTAVDV